MVKIHIVNPFADVPVDPHSLMLINSEGELIFPGEMIRVVSGADQGKTYRFECVVIYRHTYRVRGTCVARKARYLRGVELIPPVTLGCRVQAPLNRCQRFKITCSRVWAKIDDWFWAGTFALIPLAVFEHYHLAGKITEVVSLGMIATGGGH